MKRYLVDTNILLRFLCGQPPAQAAAARNLFEQAALGKVLLDLSPLIVAEAFYTLVSFYGVDRKTAAESLSQLLRQAGVKLRDAAYVLAALDRLKVANVGFADAFLVAIATDESLPIASFDRDFDKFKEIVRFQPGPA
jgi:predicted nucleic acid-binding protein